MPPLRSECVTAARWRGPSPKITILAMGITLSFLQRTAQAMWNCQLWARSAYAVCVWTVNILRKILNLISVLGNVYLSKSCRFPSKNVYCIIEI